MIIRSDWQLQTMVEEAALESLLPAGFHLEHKETLYGTVTVLDDFDWSVWEAGQVLYRSDPRNLWLLEDNDELIATDVAPERCRFWWELPPGELADQLQQIIGIRAFVVKGSLLREIQHFAVLNSDDKTVSRLHLIRLCLNDQHSRQFLTLAALRGYEAETQQICSALENLPHEEVPPLGLKQQLLQAGFQVTKAPSKPSFKLLPDEPVEAALLRMVDNLLTLARAQEQGVLADIDTEFVHQYRVNIRKARSLVSLFKKIFNPQRYQALNEALKDIGRRTNDLRDLDVFLLDYASYQKMLPDNLHPGLKQLAERLRRRRRGAFSKVRTELSDQGYREQVTVLANNLKQQPDYMTEPAQLPLKELVTTKIRKQNRRIVKDGALIGADTSDQAVHDLRIECKKLRYLLELFAELFNQADIKKLIKQLKLLQDNLGRFNDFAVQREFLQHLADNCQTWQEQLATIHGLQAVLFDRQRQERSQVVANIANFSAIEVQNVFSAIFARTDQEPDSL